MFRVTGEDRNRRGILARSEDHRMRVRVTVSSHGPFSIEKFDSNRPTGTGWDSWVDPWQTIEGGFATEDAACARLAELEMVES